MVIHDIGLVGEKSVAQVCGPGNVLIHTLKNIGESDQRLNARIPVLFLSDV